MNNFKKVGKKKAFTLVEVIIVLAIIAIIAAIAIPNLTKVRTESKRKADTQSAETIRRTVITLITDDTIKIKGTGTITFTDVLKADGTTGTDGVIDTVALDGTGAVLAPGKVADDVTSYFVGIKNPQSDGATGFNATIDVGGNVSIIVTGSSPEIKVE